VRRIAAWLLLLLAGACSEPLAPQSFAHVGPRLEPDRFFEGRTRSWGVIEDRAGEPRRRFTTEAVGRRDGGELVLTQDLIFEDGETQRRVWRLWRVDDSRYEATANVVVGVAAGEAHGNAFRWHYTLALGPGATVASVDLRHWMYLQDGGATLVNRVAITKLGIVVGQVTEYFQRVAAVTADKGAGLWSAPAQ
jgi:Protein of unknown function (DUF3833)